MRLALLAMLLALVFVFSGCSHVDLATEHAQACQAITRAHYRDRDLPSEAREIAWDQYLAWSVQLELLSGEPLPADLRAVLERGQ